jgi:hypothetical protein
MSWRFRSFVLIAAAVNLVQVPESFAKRRRSGRCYAISVEAADSHSNHDRRRRAPVLSASEAKDLEIEIALSDEAAAWPVQVKLFTPRGKLYQVLDAVAETQTAPDGARSRRRPRRHTRSLVARFPVAGTQITSHALFGEWRAEAYLGDAESPCTRSLEFVIEP